jgi:hypothetical protein
MKRVAKIGASALNHFGPVIGSDRIEKQLVAPETQLVEPFPADKDLVAVAGG